MNIRLKTQIEAKTKQAALEIVNMYTASSAEFIIETFRKTVEALAAVEKEALGMAVFPDVMGDQAAIENFEK